MIYVIGNTTVCINAELDSPLTSCLLHKTSTAPILDLAGHGALQAVSAARCGAGVSLISKIGSDLIGKYVLDTLRKEGIQTSGLSKDAKQSCLSIALNAPNETTHIHALNKEPQNLAEIIPADHLNARNLLIFSSDILVKNQSFIDWLHQVKNNGARIMICHPPEEECNTELSSYADIMISDEKNIPDSIAKDTYLVTTKACGTKGASAQKGTYVACDIQTKEKHSGNAVSFDIFCGYFAACLHAGLELKRTLEIACNAAALSIELRGAYSAIPYLGYLEDVAKETEAQEDVAFSICSSCEKSCKK
ncbi:MAG: hypothetical protein KAJ40_01915 [Alphaproteobacteria bacterium]|nr:hypothetical protein [Alphaproteobacteria bacterium]